MIYIVLIEIVQQTMGRGRSYEVADMAADLAGVLAAMLIPYNPKR